MATNSTITRGFAWPFRKEGSQFPLPSSDLDLVAVDLTRLFRMSRGQRVMRRAAGTQSLRFVFENNDVLLAENIRTEVLTVVGRYEPRVILRNVSIDRYDNEIIVQIDYAVRSTGQADQVLIPLPIG